MSKNKNVLSLREEYGDGHGTYTYPDGEKYEGEFKDGKRNGHGTYNYPNGEEYVGDWKNGKYHGHGTYTYPDGENYEREFSTESWQ